MTLERKKKERKKGREGGRKEGEEGEGDDGEAEEVSDPEQVIYLFCVSFFSCVKWRTIIMVVWIK